MPRFHAPFLALATAGIAVLAAAGSPAAHAQGSVLLEALEQIRQNATFVDPATDRAQFAADVLRGYLAGKDAHADYLLPAELQRLKRIDGAREGGGVGMELRRDASGSIRCFPDPAGAARRAGVLPADELLAVDGISVRGRSLSAVAAHLAGAVGTPVRLDLRQAPEEPPRRVQVTRSRLDPDTVHTARIGRQAIVRILGFSPNTRDELRSALRALDDPDAPVVLDLRGNGGGDVHAAIDSAMLFVAQGRPLMTLVARTRRQAYVSSVPALFERMPLVLWQDAQTASAAEVFIAALTGNKRAESVGVRSFGKGTRQGFIELSDGSALLLTDGHLLPPSGVPFDGLGLDASVAMDGADLATADYLAASRTLLQRAAAPRSAAPATGVAR